MRFELKSREGRIRVWVMTLVMLACCVTGIAGIPKAATLLPSKTVFLVEVDNFQTLWSQFKLTSYYGLYTDSAMKPFLDDFHTRRKNKASEADNELVEMIFGTGTLPTGRVAAAAVPPESADGEVAFIALAEWGENLAAVRETVDKMASDAVDEGARKSTETYRDVEITTITTVDAPQVGSGSDISDVDGEASPTTLSYCFLNDCIIVSDQIPVMQFVIAHIQGASGSTLAQTDPYSSAMNAVGPHHDADLYLNIRDLVKMMTADSPDGQGMKIVENLGLDNVVSLGGSLGVARLSGKTSSLRFMLKIDGAKKGICKMLDIKSAPPKMPSFFPADATSVSFLSLDFNQAYQELVNILTRFSPQIAAIAQMPFIPVDPQNGQYADIKSAIIDHLGTQITFASKVSKSAPALDPASTLNQMLVAMTVSNRAMLEKSLSTVHMMMLSQGNPDMKRELLGHTIYKIDLGGLMGGEDLADENAPLAMMASAGPAMPEMPMLAFTITDSHIILGSEQSVESAIRAMAGSGTDSVESAAWYRRARATIPALVGLASMSDAAAAGEHLWQQLREMDAMAKGDTSELGLGLDPAGSMLMLAGGDGLFDFSLLPEFDKVRKYFGLTAAYGISREDGFLVEIKMLEPGE